MSDLDKPNLGAGVLALELRVLAALQRTLVWFLWWLPSDSSSREFDAPF